VSGALVIGHRGASGYEYENSRAAFRAAKARGADAIELDIHAAADGVLFVHHDEMVSGVHITRSTAAQVRALRLPNGESVPTLEDALGVIDPALQVFIEVKSLPREFDDRLLAAVEPGGARFAVHGFDHRIVRRLGEARPELARGVLLASYPLRPLEPLQDTGATVLWQEQSLIDAELVETLHGAGFRIYAWTVNDPEDMRRLLSLRVDGLCTNVPDVGRRALEGGGAR
jgi:glycerophosphoryl diester phosphodiesterase